MAVAGQHGAPLVWLELAAGGTTWLAHVAWYMSRRKQSVVQTLAAPLALRAWWPALPCLSVLLLVVGWSSWVAAHGPSLGTCAALAALTAAASVNSLIAPLSPRLLLAFGSVALGAVVAGVAGWMVSA